MAPGPGVGLLGTIALGLWRGWGGSWLPAVATLAAVLDVAVGVGIAALAVGLRNFHMH